MNFMTKEKEKNNTNLKSTILDEIKSIEDNNLLQEISDFLELKKQMKEMKKEYGNNLYDTLNDEKLKDKRLNEKNIYLDLVKLLKKLTQERRKNTWIQEIDKNKFDLNEPAIKDLLNKSLFVKEIWIEKWIKNFVDQKIRLWSHYTPMNDREHFVVLTEDGKLKYDLEIWD